MMFSALDFVNSVMVFCLNSGGNLQPWAAAKASNSSITSETSFDTPTFSISAA
jgi:hypothetical protein